MGTSNQWVMGEANERIGFIENDKGDTIARVDRSARRGEDGLVQWHDRDTPFPQDQATTDEQWQAIIDQIAAAPEMLSVLKAVRNDLKRGGYSKGSVVEVIVEEIERAIAKAEPTRVERRKVRVEVDIEVDVPVGTALDCDFMALRVQDSVFIGMHDRQEFDRNTTTVIAKATKVG
jgi:hypothetical protein